MEMSKARNAYAKEREHFRRELVFALRAYDGRPISFDIKQNLRFRGSALKQECLDSYRELTRNIVNNQSLLIGSNLRLRSMCSAETPNSPLDHSQSSKSPIPCASFFRKPGVLNLEYEEDNVDTFMKNQGSWRRKDREEVSTPISKYTYDSRRTACTNTHVLSFERQLLDDIDTMIRSIDQLNDTNRDTWLKIATKDSSQYFASRFDNTGFAIHSINTMLPSVASGSDALNSVTCNTPIDRTSSDHFYKAFSRYSQSFDSPLSHK